MIPTRIIRRAFADGDEDEQIQTAWALFDTYRRQLDNESYLRFNQLPVEERVERFRSWAQVMMTRDGDENFRRVPGVLPIAEAIRDALEQVLLRPEESD